MSEVVTVQFAPDQVPYAAYSAVVFTKETNRINFVPDKSKAVTSAQVDGVQGNSKVAQFFSKQSALSGSPSAQDEINKWIEKAQSEIDGVTDLAKLDVTFQHLNHHMTHRSYAVGQRLTIADLVLYESLKKSTQWKQYQARYKKHVPHLDRYFAHLDGTWFVQTATNVLTSAVKKACSTHHIVPPTVATSSSSSSNNQSSSDEADASVIVLQHAEMGKVVTRFPPEASGYLHIGHAKAALMNQYFAEKYNGKLLLRFDDTNPEKEKEAFEQRIIQDLQLLGMKADKSTWTHTSDYFEKCQELAEQLIEQGKAYVDDTPQEQMKQEKWSMLDGANRNNDVQKNMRMWKEMLQGTDHGKTCALRAKINMQSENGALRDPVLYRCKDQTHPRHGNKYKAYPTYDFACPIVDSIEGVTHALRTSEYNDRNDQFYWVCDALNIRKPHIWDYSRMNFTYTVMSKRKLTLLVAMGAVDGWDDPRLPTIAGLMRRGLTVEALKQFILSQGASRSISTIEWEALWTVNKKYLDPIVPRYTAVDADRVVVLHLDGVDRVGAVEERPKHAKNASLGNKKVTFSNRLYMDQKDCAQVVDGEEITLMGWGNAIVNKVDKDADGVVKEMRGTLNLKGSVKTTKKKLHWLAVPDDGSSVNVDLTYYDHLLLVKALDPDAEFESQVNFDSKHTKRALGDGNLKSLKRGDKMQLERVGYFVVDVEYDEGKNSISLINIPDSTTNKK
ncbi:glutamate tRS [Acrasis kona]|uniref:glutamate--tRNA ligase n=1 Tax=Acrasis kona TaxID=1008807 RepID=A0AAW2ZE07_9EUKA